MLIKDINNTKNQEWMTNIFFVKYLNITKPKINKEQKIKNIIEKNRIYKNQKKNVQELDSIAYNL